MWLIESRFKFVNVKGNVQEDVRLRNDYENSYDVHQIESHWEYYFLNKPPKGYVTGTLKVRVRKMRPKEEAEFQKSGKLPEKF